MNIFKAVWTTYVIRAVAEKLIQDIKKFIREYPSEYERTSRGLRQFSERMSRVNKEL